MLLRAWLPKSMLCQDRHVRRLALIEGILDMMARRAREVPKSHQRILEDRRRGLEKERAWVHKNQLTKPGGWAVDTVKAAEAELGLRRRKTRRRGYRGMILDRLQDTAWGAARSSMVLRIVDEMTAGDELDWYPIFASLDIAADHYHKIYSDKPNRAFKRYIRAIRRKVGAAMGLTAKEADRRPAAELARYKKVPEFGGEGGRFHYHAVILVPKLPLGWEIDPNGARDGDSQEIIQANGIWPYGHHTNTLAVRLGPMDIWHRRHGWKWPVDPITMLARPVGTPAAVGIYSGKYLEPGKRQCQLANKITQRTSQSKGYGNALIRQLMRMPGYPVQALTGALQRKLAAVRTHGTILPSGRQLKTSALRTLRESGITSRQMVEAYKSSTARTIPILASERTREWGSTRTNKDLSSRLKTLDFDRGLTLERLDAIHTAGLRSAQANFRTSREGRRLTELLRKYATPTRFGEWRGISSEG